MLIEINRFMTAEQVRAAYDIPESLADKILPVLPVAIYHDDGTRLYLESEVDQFLADWVRRQQVAEGQANSSAPGKPGRKVETAEIALYAGELRRKGMIWKHVFKACKERWPDDERVDNEEQIRGTWRRFFGNTRRESD